MDFKIGDIVTEKNPRGFKYEVLEVSQDGFKIKIRLTEKINVWYPVFTFRPKEKKMNHPLTLIFK
jgi:hypothetical protein